MDLKNGDFRITASRFDMGALSDWTTTFYLQHLHGASPENCKFLVFDGYSDMSGRFISDSLFLLQSTVLPDSGIYRDNYLLRLPVFEEVPLTLEFASPNNPFYCDTVAYAGVSLAYRHVAFCRSQSSPEIRLVRITNVPHRLFPRIILLAPVSDLTGELVDEDTLRLEVIWEGTNYAQRFLIRLPQSDDEELEWIDEHG